MVAQAFHDQFILSYEIISGGCANLNIRIFLDRGSYILRIYLRDKDAAYRECHIASLMKYNIPIPEVLFIGDQSEGDMSYRFAVTQFIEGIPLRDLLLNYPKNAHQMPGCYENSFLEGLKKGGLELPKNWRVTIALLNISSLLDSMNRYPIHKHPILHQDICQLIGHMVKRI